MKRIHYIHGVGLREGQTRCGAKADDDHKVPFDSSECRVTCKTCLKRHREWLVHALGNTLVQQGVDGAWWKLRHALNEIDRIGREA